MSFLNKIKGLGRRDGDQDTLEQDGRFDETSARSEAPDLPLPGPDGTLALDVGAMQQTASMDSSIISEAAPSETPERMVGRTSNWFAANSARNSPKSPGVSPTERCRSPFVNADRYCLELNPTTT